MINFVLFFVIGKAHWWGAFPREFLYPNLMYYLLVGPLPPRNAVRLQGQAAIPPGGKVLY